MGRRAFLIGRAKHYNEEARKAAARLDYGEYDRLRQKAIQCVKEANKFNDEDIAQPSDDKS